MYGVRTVVPAPGASCPAAQVRTARRRLIRVARTYSTEAPGRTRQLSCPRRSAAAPAARAAVGRRRPWRRPPGRAWLGLGVGLGVGTGLGLALDFGLGSGSRAGSGAGVGVGVGSGVGLGVDSLGEPAQRHGELRQRIRCGRCCSRSLLPPEDPHPTANGALSRRSRHERLQRFLVEPWRVLSADPMGAHNKTCIVV